MHWLYTKQLGGYYDDGIGNADSKDLKVAAILVEGETILGSGGRIPEEKACFSAMGGGALIHSYPLVHLVALYVHAEYLGIPDLKDDIIRTIVEIYGKHLGATESFWRTQDDLHLNGDPVIAINLAYDKLFDEFYLRRVLLLLYVEHVKDDDRKTRMRYNPNFLCDVAGEFRARLKQEEVVVNGMCLSLGVLQLGLARPVSAGSL